MDIDLSALNGSTRDLSILFFSELQKILITSAQVMVTDNKCFENHSVIIERDNICIMGCVYEAVGQKIPVVPDAQRMVSLTFCSDLKSESYFNLSDHALVDESEVLM